ncbi:HD domain-containing protein [Thomasclavelia saccharogumia]|uniref:HD domain-containing protein n=1 Tax=Thomasclavelia saccharogumia TaxID=341225 RepID=UPI00047BB736|nr:HD domain-containing protein [Thomasclavelia saccharogumia]
MNSSAYKLSYTKLNDSKVFRDAVHNYIHVDQPVLLELINSKEMQRLRRIKQLGGTHQVYQSAEHSRFCHSLGVYFIVRKMIFNSEIGDYINDYDKLTVMCAALLHDLGHGPFSHCFEEAFGFNHEEYTIKIINNDSEVHHILENFEPGFSKKVSSVIAKTHPNKILIQMISSQLDADRMDYLLRDSYFTGTTYGHFDLYRILRVMKVFNNKIVYKASGVQAIENYILARYHMYWQVYYHPTSRSYEQLLISIFRRMKDLYLAGYDFGEIRYLEPFLKGKVNVVDYINLDENIVLYYFRFLSEGKDKILADLCNRFLNRKLFIYRDLNNSDEKLKMMARYEKKGYDPRYYVVSDDQSQIPYLYYDNDETEAIEILINHQTKALPEVSEIVGAIINSKKNKIDHKIFYPES